MIKRNPVMLDLDTQEGSVSDTSVRKKLKDFEKILKTTSEVVVKMGKSYPPMLNCDTVSESDTSVKGKISAYKGLLKATEEEVLNILKIFPATLGYDTSGEGDTSIQSKIEDYQHILKISEEEAINMIKIAPVLLGLDTKSIEQKAVKTKVKVLLSFIPKEKIIENPILLTFPAQRVKLRYIILSDLYDDLFLSRHLMTSEQLTFARRCYLKERGFKATLSKVITSKNDFAKKYGVFDPKKYPLTSEAITQLEIDYAKRTGDNLILTEEERKATLSEI
jgi:hypothetical protein